mmetsp:Transcript_13021/g.26561  ORF Transcript_13021/g.26561 Transcript_13021/m.26561 type:complete len:247 (-) Transcript_13021:129-869(-)
MVSLLFGRGRPIMPGGPPASIALRFMPAIRPPIFPPFFPLTLNLRFFFPDFEFLPPLAASGLGLAESFAMPAFSASSLAALSAATAFSSAAFFSAAAFSSAAFFSAAAFSSAAFFSAAAFSSAAFFSAAAFSAAIFSAAAFSAAAFSSKAIFSASSFAFSAAAFSAAAFCFSAARSSFEALDSLAAAAVSASLSFWNWAVFALTFPLLAGSFFFALTPCSGLSAVFEPRPPRSFISPADSRPLRDL